MKTIVAIGAVAALAVAPTQARAENGQVAAGILGGLAAGAIIGSAVRPAPPPPAYYYPAPAYAPPPAVYYVAPPAAYVAPPPSCYYTPGAPVWDGYRGMWVRPQVRVCD
jgi:hypothetical protein